MKLKNRFVAAVMTGVLAIGLTACGSTGTATGETSETAAVTESTEAVAEETVAETEAAVDPDGTHTVTDHGGNVVEVPNTINRIVVDQIPVLSTYMAFGNGSAPNVVGYSGSVKAAISETVLKDIAPELMDASDAVYTQGELNMEEVIKLEPDVIFYNANNAEHAELLKESGIPSIGFSTSGDPMELYDEWLNLLEDVFNEPGKTDDFVAAGDEIVADVESRIAEIPEEDRPTAMILWNYTNNTPMVSGANCFGSYWLEHLGVTDVASELTGFAQTNMEQIYSWAPDVIYLDGPGILGMKTSQIMNNEVDGADFSTLTAVKNGRVYGTTLGMWNWFTPNPDAPLVYAWLACKTYPEQFADYPLEDTIRNYYSTWYGYDLSDDEIAQMLEY